MRHLEAVEYRLGVRGGHLVVQQHRGARRSHPDPRSVGSRPGPRHPAQHPAARPGGDELGAAGGGPIQPLRIGPALEPVRRLAVQIQPPRGAQDPRAREICALQQDVAGLLGDLGGGSTHHAGQGDGTLQVADEQVLRRQGALHVVEGHQPLAVARVAHDDAGAGEPVHVERVERLAQFEHGVVRGVHHVRDRAHARGGETRLHLQGAHPRGIHAADDPGEVVGAALGSVEADRGHRGGLLIGFMQLEIGRTQGDARAGRDLTRHAVHAEEVRAVGLNLDVEDGIVQTEDGLDVVPHAEPLARVEDQDPEMDVRDVQLPRRAEHPVGDDAPELAWGEGLREDRHARAGLRPRHEVAGDEVPHAGADHLLPGPVVHPRDAELVRVRDGRRPRSRAPPRRLRAPPRAG